MPCHRCGARQTDPVRGASPWRRGVRRGEQVLVCPDCQQGRDWTAGLARCASCGSARLVRALGRTECKDCGAEDQVTEADAAAETSAESSGSAGPSGRSREAEAAALAEDVRAALEREFEH